MPRNSATYDPAAVTFVWGVIQIVGYIDGTFIKAARAKKSYTKRVGADGEVVRSMTKDQSGTISFSLMSSADCNALLSAAQLADELTGAGVFPVLIKDGRGLDLCSAPFGWLTGSPDMEKAMEAGEVAWEMDCDFLTIFHGGLFKHGAAT